MPNLGLCALVVESAPFPRDGSSIGRASGRVPEDASSNLACHPNSKGVSGFTLRIELLHHVLWRQEGSRRRRRNLMMRVFGRLVVAGHIMAIYIPAATYYAATNGSDSNPGTQLAPFRHLSKAAAAARQPGDTVIVMDGNYDNEGAVATADGRGSVVTLKYSGTPGNPITFRAQHRGGATLDAANVSGNTGPYACNAAWAYFDVGYTSYVVIQGFVIQHGCFNGIRANGNAHDITIKWNEIRNIGSNWDSGGGILSSAGIYLNSSEYNFTFDGNIFHDIGSGTIANQEHAIYTSASNVTIVNNVFYNQVHGWDIQTAGGTNVVIVNNTFAFPNPTTDGQLML